MSPYITHNQWFVLFFVAAPVIVLAGWRSIISAIIRCGLACVAGWVLIQLAVDRHWELRIALLPPNATPQQLMDATADGASRVFYRLLGWIPAGLYALMWLCLWLVLRSCLKRRRNQAALREPRMEASN